MRGRYSYDTGEADLADIGLTPNDLRLVDRIWIVACGTSWHAGLVGKYLLEEMVRTPVQVDIGSEFRYRDPLVGKNDLFITISQSGETADTLAAAREAKEKGARVLSIVNVVGSTLARESDGVLYTHCGPEIGVASTKAFTAQLTALYLLALHLARVRNVMNAADGKAWLDRLVTSADAGEGSAGPRSGNRGDRQTVLQETKLPVSGSRHQLSHRARRRAEAQGNFLYPCGRLCGR